MSQLSRNERATEVKCNPQQFYKAIKHNLHLLPTIFPEGYTDCKILQGDGESKGSLRQWTYILPGATKECIVKARTIKQDDEDMIIAMDVEDGEICNDYKQFIAIVQVIPKGEGSLVKWSIEFERKDEQVAEPLVYLQLFSTLSKKVDAYVNIPKP